MTSPCETSLIEWLDERCIFLRHLEKTARHILYEEANPERYGQLMRQKALFLESLADEAAPMVAKLPQEQAARVSERLARFGQSAANALGLDSVFYMSALLYPEDHKEGDPNDLERFIAELKNQTT